MSGLKALYVPLPRNLAPDTRLEPDRAVAIAFALAIQIVILWLLLQPVPLPKTPRVHFHEEPITLWVTLPKIKAPEAPAPALKPKKKTDMPAMSLPVPEARGMPAQPPPPAAPEPGVDYNGLRALGQYLNNCSGMNYEALSERNWAHCLADQWDLPPPDAGRGLRMGDQAPSVWLDQKKKKAAPARPFTKPCENFKPNSNLGLPCVNLVN